MDENEFDSEKIKTSLMSIRQSPEVRLSKIKERLKYVTTILETFGDPPDSGNYLLVLDNGEPQSWYPLSGESIKIGRAEDMDVVLNDSNASRFHCVLESNNEIWSITDRESRNGIFINGEKVPNRILCDGDLVQVACYELIFIKNEFC